MIAASRFIINTLLQRGVLREAPTQNRFNGFYPLSQTAEAVSTPPSHSYTPLKQGVNERNPLRIAGVCPKGRVAESLSESFVGKILSK
jgi:hypothetical protein